MSIFERWVHIDLEAGPYKDTVPNGFFQRDAKANRLGVIVTKGLKKISLTGTIQGVAKLPIEGDNLFTFDGYIDSEDPSRAYVDLPAEVYFNDGFLTVAIRLINGEDKLVLATFRGHVSGVTGGNTTVPVGTLPDDIDQFIAYLTQLEQDITNATNAAAYAERVNISQTKSGNVITITTTDRTGAQTAKTVTEPTVSLSEANDVITLSVTDVNGTQSTSFPDPSADWAFFRKVLLGNTKYYGVKWDQIENKCVERLWDAKNIPLDTTHYAHLGSIDQAHSNPFDDIYPWSGRKVCNVSLSAYQALTSGQSLKACVTAWEGEDGFSSAHEDGLWVYTPEFWHTDFIDANGYRIIGVADGEVPGWIHSPERIYGVTFGIDEVRGSSHYLLPKAGNPLTYISGVTQHNYAKTYGGTLDNYYSEAAENALYLVEYADFNTQTALGNGVDTLYEQNSRNPVAEVTNSATVKLPTSMSANLIKGSRLAFGTTNGGTNVGIRYVVSDPVVGSDGITVTLNEAITLTTAHFVSVHAKANVADEMALLTGSFSGYIGANSKSNAYYRGRVFHANLWRYILGCYHGTDRHIWLANGEAACNSYDAINTSQHTDTGVSVAETNGYTKSLAYIDGAGVLAITTEIGGSSAKPTGDYWYQNGANNTVLRVGGAASSGPTAGRFSGIVNGTASYVHWSYAASPLLLLP